MNATRRDELARLIWQHFEGLALDKGIGDRLPAWENAPEIREPFIQAVSEMVEWDIRQRARVILERLGVSHLFGDRDPYAEAEAMAWIRAQTAPTQVSGVIEAMDHITRQRRGDRNTITHEQRAQSVEAEAAADQTIGSPKEHPDMHMEGLSTHMDGLAPGFLHFYSDAGTALLKADPDTYRVVGVDTFANEDWVYQQYATKAEAIDCATHHAHNADGTPKHMLKVYVYDDEGRVVWEGGSR